MRWFRYSSTLAVLGALAAPAFPQDSVSKAQGLPGDAVSAYSTGEQVNRYVVDLRDFFTSWGTKFGIAPVMKASADSATPRLFFNHLISSQAISNTSIRAPFPFNSYFVWKGPGLGVNDSSALNDPGMAINTTNFSGFQFAAAFAEFGGISNNVIGAVVNVRPLEPARLYVSRIAGAVNAPDGTCNLAQVGLGHVDADGNFVFRADRGSGGSMTAPGCGFTDISGVNYYRSSLLDRNFSVRNVLNSLGASDAPSTTRVITNSGVQHNCPNLIPEHLAGRPIVIGSNFNNQYVREAVAGSVTSDSTHFAPGATDQRGGVGYTHQNFGPPLSSGHGIAGILTKITGSGGPTETFNLFGLGANGAVTGTLQLLLPNSDAIFDPCTGFTPASAGPGRNEFNHYGSQVVFRGNAPVAIGVDQKGRLLAAAETDFPTPMLNTPLNYIAVARFDERGNTEWSIAGYSADPTTGRGKPILDGPGGNVIGHQTLLGTVTGGSPFGPSLSSPMIDSVGNIWFLSAIEINLDGGGTDPGVGLLRAVYDPDRFCYELELVFETGDVFRGRNSDRNFQIRFLDIADSNSVSSAGAFAGNINQSSHLGSDVRFVKTRKPETLGGIVINAEIVYDVNRDGSFDKVTGTGGNPMSLDQEYNVILYVGATDIPNQLFEVPPAPATNPTGPLRRQR